MAAMGRKRKNNRLGLPERVYLNHGKFFYVHRDGRWENLGTDLAEAKRRGNLYNDPAGTYGTMEYFLSAFLVACEKRVRRGDLAQRTHDDYAKNIAPLKAFFGKMTPAGIEPKHVAQYLDIGAELARPVRANREKACLSACFSWLIRNGEGGIRTNPCIGVKRNRETPRERYVEHDELAAVRSIAHRQVRGLMDLIYSTLQRPEDIILWTPANIVRKVEPDGSIRRVIRSDQGKTGRIVDIAITDEIEAIMKDLRVDGAATGPGMTFIHTAKGEPYTYDGLSSMLRRSVERARNDGDGRPPKFDSFGFYDLKGKGATDMWLHGVPLEQIQALCGHESIKTTEVYVKCRWRGTVQPNSLIRTKKSAK